jgi:hypothetical protein
LLAALNGDQEPEVRGVNLHARQWIHGNDRRALERLGRYVTRPPIAQHRLHERADGTLLLTLKSAWRVGTRAIVLEPDTLMARLCPAVPPPRFHVLRYYGVLSSHSKHRAEIVATIGTRNSMASSKAVLMPS